MKIYVSLIYCLSVVIIFNCLLSHATSAPLYTLISNRFTSDSEEIGQMTIDYIKHLINNSIIETRDLMTNETCYENLNYALEDPDDLYIIKLLSDSAKNKNDLGSYLDCFTINYKSHHGAWTNKIVNNLTYVIFHVNQAEDYYSQTDIRFESGNFVFGACIPRGCNREDYRTIFYSLNNHTGIFPNTTIDNINIYDWGEHSTDYKNPSFYFELIPVYILLFLLLCTCLPAIPVNMFKCCFKKKSTDESYDNSDLQIDYNTEEIKRRFREDDQDYNSIDEKNAHYDDKKENVKLKNQITKKDENIVKKVEELSKEKSKMSKERVVNDYTKLNSLKQCFVLNENAEEILKTNISIHNSTINNDSGLSIVKGIIGINMIFTIVGCVFKILYSSPIKIYCNIAFRQLLMNPFFSCIMFGLRFGPRIFFAMSGYTLMYKFLCYLDNEVERFENTDKKEEKDRDSDSIGNKNKNNTDINNSKDSFAFEVSQPQQHNQFTNSMSKVFSNNLSTTKYMLHCSYSDYSASLPKFTLFYFIFLQSYKYLMYVFGILLFKFSYYNFIDLIYSPGPMWVYLKEIIINPFGVLNMVAMIFFFSLFSGTTYYHWDMFWMATNEIFFFLTFTIIIFIFYRKNWRLDIFLLVSIMLIMVAKLVLFLLFFYEGKDKFLPSLSFQYYEYYYIVKNPFYNMPIYMIGLFFGSVNYTIQKSITIDNFYDINKKFLHIPCKFRSFFRKYQLSKVILTSIFFGVLFLLTIFGYNIIYNNFFAQTDVHMNNFYHSLGVNLFFLWDIEFGVFFMFMIIIPLFLIGDNFLISLLKHEYWNFFARPYYMFILMLNMVILYIFYQSESRVKLEMFNIVFFSLLCLMIMMIFSACCYIIYEVPLKKLNKFIMEQVREKYMRGYQDQTILNKSKSK